MYRVTVEYIGINSGLLTSLIQKEGIDKYSIASQVTDANISSAVYHAVRGSLTFTERAFVLGIIAEAVRDGIFSDATNDKLRDILRDEQIPKNVREIVKLALDGTP